MIKNIVLSCTLYIVCLIMVGIYFLTIYMIGDKLWPDNLHGSLIIDQRQNIRGSKLIAQKNDHSKYFMPRPTYKINSSCDVALYNNTLKSTLIEQFKDYDSPYDISLLTPSASLLDPYITTREALIQAHNIAKERHVKVENIMKIINDYKLLPSSPFFELEIVNTTILNAKLDGYL